MGTINEGILNVMSLSKLVYSKVFQEDCNVFIQIIECFPEEIFDVFEKEKIADYFFSHPYQLPQIKHLNSQLSFTGKENCLDLQDMAISNDYQGMGLIKQLFEKFQYTFENNGFENLCFVAVQNSAEFWGKFGSKQIAEVNYSGYTNGIYM